MTNENVAIDGNCYWNYPVQVHEKRYKKYGEQTERNIAPDLFGVGEKGGQHPPDVSDTVEVDHAAVSYTHLTLPTKA